MLRSISAPPATTSATSDDEAGRDRDVVGRDRDDQEGQREQQFVREDRAGGGDHLEELVQRPHQQPVELAVANPLRDLADG